MSRPQEPLRSPADLWTLLGEHPAQRHHDMLAERLHHLSGMPDRRAHRIRRLMIVLHTIWSRPSARDRLSGVQQASSGSRLGPEHDATGEVPHGISWL